MARRASLLAVLAVSLSGALAACGGGGQRTLSANQLRTRASTICTDTSTAMDRVPLPNAPAGGGQFLRRGLLRLQPALDQLKALKPPDELRAGYAHALQLETQELDVIAAHEQSIRGGDDVIATFRRLQTAIAPILQEEDTAWRDLELPDCVKR